MVHIKVLSIQYPERYALRRLVIAAQQELLASHPGLQLEIEELGEPGQIGRYAHVLVLPTLVVNEVVVCSARFPTREEVKEWLVRAAD